MNPKILTLDIENGPHKVWTWGWYEQNVIDVIEYGYILMVGVKRLGERTKVYTQLTHPGKSKKDPSNILRAVHNDLEWADIVVTQNGDQFDIKKLNTAFLKMGLPPPSPFKSVDTKKTSKRHFMFANNKLDNLGEELGFGGKMSHEGFPLWLKVMAGDPRAIKKMACYCARDVDLTEKVYLKERPWMATHPNHNVYTEREACSKCGSADIQYRGVAFRKSGKVHRFQCKKCGGWSFDTKTIKVTSRV